MTVQDVEPLAAGRVWSGTDAHAHGLVDRLGGFEEALSEVRTRVGAGAEQMRPVLIAPRKLPSLPAALRSMSVIGSFERIRASELVALASTLGDRVWLWSPWSEVDSSRP